MRITEATEITGKTVKLVVEDTWDSPLIVFTDGTYINFAAVSGDDVSSRKPIQDYMMVKAGLMSEEEFNAKAKRAEEARLGEQHQREMREFQRLKAKYGTQG